MLHFILFLIRVFTFFISLAIGIGIFFIYRIKINENEYNRAKQILYIIFTLLVMFTFNSWWLVIIYALLNLGEYVRKNEIEQMINNEEELLDDFADEFLDRDLSNDEIGEFINKIVNNRNIRKNKKLIIYIIDYENKKKRKSVPEKVIVDLPLSIMKILASKHLQKFSFIPKNHRKKLKIFRKIYKILKKTKDPFSITINADEKGSKAFVKIFVA